jgi:putative lipoic acid-binding regulatory protein
LPPPPSSSLTSSATKPAHLNHSALHAKAGSFFNQVPDSGDSNEEDDEKPKDQLEVDLADVLKQHRKPSKAQIPSTINGIPLSEAGKGFGRPNAKHNVVQVTRIQSSKTYVGIGPPSLNDVANPAVDDQGYTLYTDERTGEKSRVFEALVDYPCLFTLKIVGANDGAFVADMISIVASTCDVEVADDIDHTVKVNGKWTSVTVQAPVKSAAMLYELYENVDRDPRVKFKF